MAIHANGNNNPTNQGQPAAPQQNFAQPNNAMQNALNNANANIPNPNQQAPNYQQNPQQFSWVNAQTLNPYYISTSQASASLTQLDKALKEYWDNHLDDSYGEVSSILIDRNAVPNMAVSVLVIVLRRENKDTAPIAYHSLLLESSIDGNIPPRIANVNGKQIEVIQMVSDTYDSVMMEAIAGVVQQRFPNASHHLSADAEVIPRYFDITREDNMHNITLNAALACSQQLTIIRPDFKDLNVANARPDSVLTQTIQYGKATEQDQLSLPVRSDIIMTTVATPKQNQNNILNIPIQSVITRVTGYLDLLYNDADNFFTGANNPFVQMQAMNGPTPVLQTNLVITQLVSAKLQTLPSILLALVNVTAIRESDRFLLGLMPQHGSKDNMHDIGNIGYDIPIMTNQQGQYEYTKFATTPDKFDLSYLYMLYKKFFHQGLVISLDIPECGALTWQYKVIAAAAVGRQEAMVALRNAANCLTNGFFDKYYNGTGQYVFTTDNTIYMGYYQSKDGPRDIRDLDYIAICGLAGKKDKREISVYTDTYDTRGILEEKLNTRRMLINNYLRDVVFTGRAIRVNFEAAFINALIQGVADCGYTVIPQQPYVDNMNYQRANAGYVTGAILNANASNIFRNTGPAFQGGAYTGRFANGFSLV